MTNTIEDLSLDVHYGHFFNLKCERFYRRVDLLLNVVQLLGGSAAMFVVMSDQPHLLTGAGVALASAAALSLLVGPAAKAANHAFVKDRFTALIGRYRSMNPDELAQVIADYRVGAPVGIDSLAMPAYNAAALAMGREDAVAPLSGVQRVAQAIA